MKNCLSKLKLKYWLWQCKRSVKITNLNIKYYQDYVDTYSECLEKQKEYLKEYEKLVTEFEDVLKDYNGRN